MQTPFKVYTQAGHAAKATEALTHARELFNFADQFRGKYSDVITNAASFYNSHSVLFSSEIAESCILIGSDRISILKQYKRLQ